MSVSNIGESIENAINEAVDNAIGEADFSDKIQDALPDLEGMVEKAVNEIDIDDKVNDAIREYDFSDDVQKEVEKELEANLGEYVQNEMAEYVKTDKFKELIAAQVAQFLKVEAEKVEAEKVAAEKVAAEKVAAEKVEAVVVSKGVWGWVAAKWDAMSSWY